MASRIESFQVTVPAATAQATPADTNLNFNRGVIEVMEIVVPPGPSGLVGFAIVHSGQQIIPFASGEFIVADNETLQWNLERYPEASPWTVRAYNTDVYDHTLYFRLYIDDTPEGVPSLTTPLIPDLFIPPGGESGDESEPGASTIDDLIGDEVEATP